jgi:hypothetical protein
MAKKIISFDSCIMACIYWSLFNPILIVTLQKLEKRLRSYKFQLLDSRLISSKCFNIHSPLQGFSSTGSGLQLSYSGTEKLFLKFNDNGGIINTDIKQPNVCLSYPVSPRVSLKKLVKTKMLLLERQPGTVIINFAGMCKHSNPSQLLSPIISIIR